MDNLYRVTSPAIVIRLADKGERYVYRDGIVDAATVKAGEIDRMIELGFIEPVEAQAKAEQGDPDPANPPVNPGEGGSADQVEVVLTDLNLAELRALASDRGVDLQDVTKKADIIAALEAASA